MVCMVSIQSTETPHLPPPQLRHLDPGSAGTLKGHFPPHCCLDGIKWHLLGSLCHCIFIFCKVLNLTVVALSEFCWELTLLKSAELNRN